MHPVKNCHDKRAQRLEVKTEVLFINTAFLSTSVLGLR